MASVDNLWLVDFGEPYPGEPVAHRPALVIGPPDTFGAGFPFVIVTPLTITPRGLSLHVEVEATQDTGIDHTSYVQCELIRSINRKRLVRRLGSIGPDASSQVATIIKTLLNY
ncbi:MAG: type II toxin-antitoxin system PemK/MazF family toxin [Acidimicrobiia bacterium]|nr:type II toxin-antitoxin system PemK/MazF family toxin [Acidimicrobiia bacterium]